MATTPYEFRSLTAAELDAARKAGVEAAKAAKAGESFALPRPEPEGGVAGVAKTLRALGFIVHDCRHTVRFNAELLTCMAWIETADRVHLKLEAETWAQLLNCAAALDAGTWSMGRSKSSERLQQLLEAEPEASIGKTWQQVACEVIERLKAQTRIVPEGVLRPKPGELLLLRAPSRILAQQLPGFLERLAEDVRKAFPGVFFLVLPDGWSLNDMGQLDERTMRLVKRHRDVSGVGGLIKGPVPASTGACTVTGTSGRELHASEPSQARPDELHQAFGNGDAVATKWQDMLQRMFDLHEAGVALPTSGDDAEDEIDPIDEQLEGWKCRAGFAPDVAQPAAPPKLLDAYLPPHSAWPRETITPPRPS